VCDRELTSDLQPCRERQVSQLADISGDATKCRIVVATCLLATGTKGAIAGGVDERWVLHFHRKAANGGNADETR
jgi:hypothetical protein